jgi:hypothetical protein
VTVSPPPPAGPEAMREAMANYIHAVHESYLTALAQAAPDVDATSLPLGTGPFTVAAVGASQLHVIATRELTLAADPREVSFEAMVGPLSWTVRFLDPVVLPPLGLVDDRGPDGGRALMDALGIDRVLYHLTASIDGSLSPHQAMHAGTGLAHAHLKAAEGGGD